MSSLFDSSFLLFLALGCGFALVAILMSWWSADYGLAEVLTARRDRDRYKTQVESLKRGKAALRDEWPTIYIGLRKLALENIADGKALMEFYCRIVRDHSRYHDIEMVFPEMHLPQELEAAEPPPLPAGDVKEENEEERESRQ